MEKFLWMVIVVIFVLSVAGMFFSAIIWSSRSRDIIISAWVLFGDRAESPDLDKYEFLIYQESVDRLLLSEKGKVSKKKTLAFAIIATVFWLMGAQELFGLDSAALPLSPFQFSIEQFAPAAYVVLVAILSHWIFEFVFTYSFHRKLLGAKNRGFASRVLVSLSYGVFVIFLLSILIVFGFNFVNLLQQSIGMWSLDAWRFIGRWNIFFDLIRFNGGALLISELGREYLFGEVGRGLLGKLFLALSLSSSGIAAFLALMITAIASSKNMLRIAAKICETVAKQSAKKVFAFSMSLFAVSTGFMQAFTFFPVG